MDVSIILPKLLEIAKKLGGKLLESNTTKPITNDFSHNSGTIIQYINGDKSPIDARKVLGSFDKSIEQTKDEGGYDFLTESFKTKKTSLLTNGICLSEEEFSFVQEVIPKSDRSLWFTASLLKSKNKPDFATVEQIKLDLREKAGERGNNIANLCSTNYLSDEIIKTYNSLPDEGREEAFTAYYENLVTTMRRSVFVNIWTSKKKLIKDISQKVESAKKYRLLDVRVHAMGESNIKKLSSAVEEYISNNKEHTLQDDQSAVYTRNVRIIIGSHDDSTPLLPSTK